MPARQYVPEAAIDKRITVRQLLDHTSGLDDFFLHPPIDKALLAERDAFWSVRRTLRYVGKPYFPPGRGWHYSNTNYVYLGLIAERVTGVPLAIELRQRFLVPHDLDETWYQAVEKPIGPARPRVPVCRLEADGTADRPVGQAAGRAVPVGRHGVRAGPARSPPPRPTLHAGRGSSTAGTILGPEMTAQMLDGVAGTAGYRPRVPYGLGVQAFPIGGRLAVGHSGRLLGFRSAVRHLPNDGVTIAVLTNQSRADPSVIVADLLSIVFEPEPPCFVCPRPD